jgi:SAM-dependent methyltransferase
LGPGPDGSAMTFEEQLATRSAAVYADFLLPHLRSDMSLLDVGCGSGSITLGLAPRVARVIGVDIDGAEFDDARTYSRASGIDNVDFRVGSVYGLDFPDHHFDACLAHSMVETLDRPVEALAKIRRVLRPGGVVGVASVEYGGLILGGPDEPLLRRFYELRTLLWQDEGVADPYRGRALRGVLVRAGFELVKATTTTISYGTDASVQAFGRDRAEDCRDPWYAEGAERLGVGSSEDLREMERAWLAWSESADAFASFTWCRAIGFRPDP